MYRCSPDKKTRFRSLSDYAEFPLPHINELISATVFKYKINNPADFQQINKNTHIRTN
ncbi:hypothetical protein TUM12151_17590 [Morganella morganii]|nr:hypothetical protein TUM12149_14140 [Morganella morganii]GIZ32773.1 hypothetical protein TUM12150_32590 [Morganella morganii]GIZ34773.1 hypothetical protein TUM12151_17590 [Morganella morganii]